MSLMGEHVAEEWLNRQGYFTIRGVKVGTGEIDLLAVKPNNKGVECWHYEVQFSLRPISYICAAPKKLRDEGVAAHNAKKRTKAVVRKAVREWVEKKYFDPKKEILRKSLCSGRWKYGLIVGNVRHEEELSLIQEQGISIIRIVDKLQEISSKRSTRKKGYPVVAAAGSDLMDLMFAHTHLNGG